MKIKFLTIVFVIMSNINIIVGMSQEDEDINTAIALSLSEQTKKIEDKKTEFHRILQESLTTHAKEQKKRELERELERKKQEEQKKISDQNKLQERLSHAIEKKNLNEVKNLVENEGANVNNVVKHYLYFGDKKEESKISHLKEAIVQKNLDIIKYLISKGANINYQDTENFTPLIDASCPGIPESILKYLVDQGAHLNIQNIHGYTALHTATLYNNFLKVKYLVERGAELNIKDNKGNTPLILAFRKERPDQHDYDQVIRYLIEQGADVNIVNEEGKSALDYPNIANVYKQFVQESIKPKIKQHLPSEISNIAADYC